jgi:hypothetical protein
MHVILLDRYVGDYGPGQYAVSHSGTLRGCRQKKKHNCTTFPLPMSGCTEGAQEPKTLLDPFGNVDAGRIVELL